MIENLAELCSTIGWKVKLPYLAEEISKQSTEGVDCFLPAAYGKMQEERDKLRKDMVSKKKHTLDHLGGSQSIQIANDARVRKFTLMKDSERKSKVRLYSVCSRDYVCES